MPIDTPEDLAQILAEIEATITNPAFDPARRFAAVEQQALALSLTADKHDMNVREVWEICKKMDARPDLPMMEPHPDSMTREDRVFWDAIAEWDLLETARKEG
jgi:hypothetical protein